MRDQSEALHALVDAIVGLVHPLRIIAFGSAVVGTGVEASDLDLLIVMPDGTHRRKVAQDLYRQIRGIGFGGSGFPSICWSPRPPISRSTRTTSDSSTRQF